MAKHDMRALCDELHAAIAAHDEASWDYAEALEGTAESREAGARALRAGAELRAAENRLRLACGVPELGAEDRS